MAVDYKNVINGLRKISNTVGKYHSMLSTKESLDPNIYSIRVVVMS